ncbi:hypothetical protein GLX27_003127 [Malassezia furfur]|uniref:Uncharacterized protein n=1 Tax=Malassezia furfur TaxID=55194 RepID=A0ABY8ES90_MALFU|nr:hypothetical protein GLX27_003127 [Malassezia furfur]
MPRRHATRARASSSGTNTRVRSCDSGQVSATSDGATPNACTEYTVLGTKRASCTSSVGECLCGLVSGNVYGASAAAPGASAGARTPAALAGRPTLFPELACGRLARRLAALDAALGQHVRVLVLP